MKNYNRVAYMAAFSFVFVALAISNVWALSPGLGLSDYKLNETMVVSSTGNFAVARLYNVGDFDLTVHVYWIPSGDDDGVVIVVPESMFLVVNASEKVFVDVLAEKVGNYSGVIEFACEAVNSQEGASSVTPGGSTKYNISVVDAPLPSPVEDAVIEDNVVDLLPSQDDNLPPQDIPTQNDSTPTDKSPPVIEPQTDIHNRTQTLDVGMGLVIVTSAPIVCSVIWYKRRRRRKNED